MPDQAAADFALEKYREYLGAIEHAWQRLTSAIDRLDPVEIESPGTCGDWSVKDLVAHVAVWDKVAIEKIHGIVSDTLPEIDESLDEFNDRTTRESRSLDLDALLQRMTLTHQSLRGALDDVSPQPAGLLERIEWATVDDTWKHYDEHLSQIEARFPKARATP